ncbi:MAG: lipocalin family protein [Campylobacterales bacterium]|nr:lipocalin family protein [Campylobacterales bacterium]
MWYEIARTDNPYERNCVAATVEYTHIKDDEFQVDNRCFEGEIDGERIHYQGRANAADERNFARIDMTYFWIFSRQYRVIYLDAHYQSAVVSDDKLHQLWIMHRAPFMPEQTLGAILALLEPYGVVDQLIWTPQDPQGRYQ